MTPETQQAWVDATVEKTSRQIEEMVRGHKPGDMPTDAPAPGCGYGQNTRWVGVRPGPTHRRGRT